MRKIHSLIIFILVASVNTTAAFADGADLDDPHSRLAPFQELIGAGEYREAINKLDQALKDAPKDADLLNLIAYSHRNLEEYDKALGYYLMAIKVEPEHRGANEYLGELYLKLKQPEKAKERLAVLDDACFFGCDEYTELKQEIESYMAENPF